MVDDKKHTAAKVTADDEDVVEEAPKIGETVPGGAYKVGGVMVDADGKPLSTKKEADKK